MIELSSLFSLVFNKFCAVIPLLDVAVFFSQIFNKISNSIINTGLMQLLLIDILVLMKEMTYLKYVKDR
jgi:hypothetical protein